MQCVSDLKERNFGAKRLFSLKPIIFLFFIAKLVRATSTFENFVDGEATN